MDKILLTKIILISLIFIIVFFVGYIKLKQVNRYYEKKRKNVIDMNTRNKI